MIYIRTDANEQIATGHVMRCLSIADAAIDMGEETTFIISDDRGLELIKSRGYRCIVMNTSWDDMDSEIEELSEIIRVNGIKKLLIDSYYVTYNYLSAINRLTNVYYIDDLDAFEYPVSGLICYSSIQERQSYREKYNDIELLLGSKYIPLRREFQNEPLKKEERNSKTRLLITTGGGDNSNIIRRLLNILDIYSWEKIYVICGMFNNNYESIVSEFKECKNVSFRSNVSDMRRYMIESNLAISAGGTTVFELCSCGTPSVVFSIADNQIENAQLMSDKGLILYAGDISDDTLIDNVKKEINYYENMSNKQKKDWINKLRNYVDGYGAKRIAEALSEK